MYLFQIKEGASQSTKTCVNLLKYCQSEFVEDPQSMSTLIKSITAFEDSSKINSKWYSTSFSTGTLRTHGNTCYFI